jgi:predicted transposase/invertase (TIGR01784 family)
VAYDNACKYLAEEYPADFVNWLLSESEATNIQVIKSELGIEPIRADSLTFLQTTNKILHLEFQTTPESDPPLSLRMLDYWVRLYRQYQCHIEQVVIFLKPTNSDAVFTEQFEATNTLHRYRVIRLWEQDPTLFLNNVGLLPLATLARTDSPQTLLEQVARQIARIDSRDKRQLLSGLVGFAV